MRRRNRVAIEFTFRSASTDQGTPAALGDADVETRFGTHSLGFPRGRRWSHVWWHPFTSCSRVLSDGGTSARIVSLGESVRPRRRLQG
jgi:hypothetical protein